MDADQPQSHHRVTVKEAAQVLGITPEAVRARIKRGTLPKDKGEDGTVYVLLDADQSRWDGDGSGDGTTAKPLIVIRLENEVEWLRREVERKDTIIMQLSQSIAALEAPRDARDARETASEERSGTEAPPDSAKRVSWWRRLFGE